MANTKLKVKPLRLAKLTERQLEIYQFIVTEWRRTGQLTTFRAIGRRFNISSPNGVMCHLRTLVNKGWLVKSATDERICYKPTQVVFTLTELVVPEIGTYAEIHADDRLGR